MTEEPILYEFDATTGATAYGVPARSLTARQFARLGPLQQREVRASPLYREVKASLNEMNRDELDAEAARRGIEGAADLRTKADVIAAINQHDAGEHGGQEGGE